MKIDNGNMAATHIDIGTFEITSGSAVVSDPCYELGTWCAGKLYAANGLYKARIGKYVDQFDANRILGKIAVNNAAVYSIEKYGSALIEELYQLAKSLNHNSYIVNDPTLTPQQLEFINGIAEFFKDHLIGGKISIEGLNYDASDDTYDYVINSLTIKTIKAVKFPDMFLEDNIRMTYYSKSDKIKYPDDDNHDELSKYYKKLDKLKVKYFIENKDSIESADIYKRVAYMQFTLSDFTNFNSDDWVKSTINVGVDSGQAGIYDYNWYKDYNGERRPYDTSIDDDITFVVVNPVTGEETAHNDKGSTANPTDKIVPIPDKLYYEDLCSLTETRGYDHEYNEIIKPGAGTFKDGFVSSTAWGDGGYNLYIITDKYGNMVEGVIHFNESYDEEDEE